MPHAMLSIEAVRLLSAVAVASVVGGGILFSRHGRIFGGIHGRVLARAPIGPLWYRVWELLVSIPILALVLGVVTPSWVYTTSWNLAYPGDSIVQIFGFLTWGAGGLLVVAAARALGRFMVVDIAVAEDHEIVTYGPYARIRHPAYTATILMALGIFLFFLHMGLLAVAVATAAVAVRRAFFEEALLTSTPPIADAYREYMTRTGRFLPKRR